MPREAIAYLCAFKCGRHATLNRKAVEIHERTCAKNPARRACKTCKHNVIHKGDDPEFDRGVMVYPGEPGGFECTLGLRPLLAMSFDCESWEEKV